MLVCLTLLTILTDTAVPAAHSTVPLISMLQNHKHRLSFHLPVPCALVEYY